jgi:transposase
MKRGGAKKKRRDCPRCAELERIVAEQQRTIERLEKRVRELEDRQPLHSQNSSIAPSKDPPQAPPRTRKEPTGRRRGGQPGHPGAQRELVALAEVDKVVEHIPERCEHCRAPLPRKTGPSDPPPLRHQVWDLAEKLTTVTEHQVHARTCPACRELSRAELPPECQSAFGAQLVTLVASLTGVLKASRRGAQEFVQDVIGVPISLGALSALEAEVSESLSEAYLAAGQSVRQAARKNVDETGWKEAGQRCWLWVAATTAVAFYVIHRRRGQEGFKALLHTVRGVLTTDRWQVYAVVKNRWRQICWSHLKRDFTRLSEREGEAGRLGKEALEITALVFYLWKDFKAHIIDRQTLKACLRPLKAQLRQVLQQGLRLDLPKVSVFCANLLDLEPALWNFARYENLEPTNNHAERVLRAAVLWRKGSFGCNSQRGCRYVERMLTATQSCRLQQRRIHEFLRRASITAMRTGTVAPSLLRASA